MQSQTLGPLDFFILVGYLAVIMAVGAWFFRRGATTGEYLFAGRGMSWIPVCISITAAHVSAITYLGTPAFVYRRDLETLPMVLMLPLVVLPLVSRYFVPFYHRLRLSTAYEYLERRFDLRVRTVASLLFLALRGFYMGIVIYAPALVLSVAAGLPLVESILLMGLLTTVYTTLGGMRAVIWTDMIQFFILVLGIISITAAAVHGIPGSWTDTWHLASAAGKTRLITFSTDITQEFTIGAVLFGSGFFILSTFATDQIILQRYMTARSARECQRALYLQSGVLIPLTICLQVIGVLLAVYYSIHPKQAGGMPSPDAVLPFFAVQHLPAGLKGLVVASIFAAAMGAMSGGITSLTTATVIDFYKRLYRPQASDSEYLRVSRIATVCWGVVATVIALFAGRLGELANAFNRVNSFIGGVILALFLLGMLTRRTDGTSALIGALLGFASVVWLASYTKVSWLFYGLVGCGITMGAAMAVNWLRGSRPIPDSILTLAGSRSEQNVIP
jgi:SSS family transporter